MIRVHRECDSLYRVSNDVISALRSDCDHPNGPTTTASDRRAAQRFSTTLRVLLIDQFAMSFLATQ